MRISLVVASAAIISISSFLLVAPTAPATATGAPALGARLVGEPANDFPHGVACASRIAIDVTFGSVCTDVCVTEAQCPSDWICKSIEQGNGEDIGLCFPRRVLSERE